MQVNEVLLSSCLVFDIRSTLPENSCHLYIQTVRDTSKRLLRKPITFDIKKAHFLNKRRVSCGFCSANMFPDHIGKKTIPQTKTFNETRCTGQRKGSKHKHHCLQEQKERERVQLVRKS